MGLLGLTDQPLASQVIHNNQVAPSASSFRKQIFHKFSELYQLPHYFNESHSLLPCCFLCSNVLPPLIFLKVICKFKVRLEHLSLGWYLGTQAQVPHSPASHQLS